MQATETFALGGTQVTTVIEIDLNSVWLISGNFSGTIPAGQTGFINGNVNLTGDLIVEGFLTGIDTFTLEGNGFQILVQDGGVINLQGVEKSGWVRWGETPVGWQTGDLLSVAPTIAGGFTTTGVNWSGAWGTRPPNSPDVTLPDGRVMKPEVANLNQTIVLQNLKRIHFHDGAGVQTLKWLKILNSGITNLLAHYPLHFHLNGESSRGSLIEGVVVRSGKNHAFVPHGSHGITFRDCVASATINDAFWWDPPLDKDHTANNSNDILYDHCLAMNVTPVPGDPGFRLSAFLMIAGARNIVRDSVASCVQGGSDSSGFNWPESGNNNVGGNRWTFTDNVAHNNKNDGIFVWQNDSRPHEIKDFIAYRNGLAQVDHGAYLNDYDYRDVTLMGGSEGAFKLHAIGNIVLENIHADTRLRIEKHNLPHPNVIPVRNCTFSSVEYRETGGSPAGTVPSNIRYEDCGLTPAKFSMTGAVQSSVVEVYQAGVLAHRWTQGVWM